MTEITLLENPEDTQTELLQPRDFTRTPFQEKRDAELLDKVNEWKAKGSPAPVKNEATGMLEPNPEAPSVRYTVDKANLADIKHAVRRAAQLHKVGLAWYKDKKNESGTVTIKASVAPLPPKKEKATTDGQPQGDQPQGDQPQGDQENPEEPQGRGRR